MNPLTLDHEPTVAELQEYFASIPRRVLADGSVRVAIRHPEELIAELESILKEEPRTRCVNCGRDIVLTGGDIWLHTNKESNRKCRAASFTVQDGWDDSLDRKWQAAPPKDWDDD